MSDEHEIMDLNARILDAEEQGTAADLEPLLAESFFIVRSSGQKLDRAAFLADVPNQSRRGRRAAQPAVHQLGELRHLYLHRNDHPEPGWLTQPRPLLEHAAVRPGGRAVAVCSLAGDEAVRPIMGINEATWAIDHGRSVS